MEEEKYMRRCIQLAKQARCNAAPNPLVGAVIVNGATIIGEGYHVHCGEAHAEVNAIASVKDPSLLKHATLYVSLEPCSHYGKTPPCVDLIIEKQLPRVVIGCQDPFVEVAGRGIKKLREAGCEVIVGMLEGECKQLIERFLTFQTLHRPYITLKWAESADGYIDIDREDGNPTLLSTTLTSMLVHKMRAEHTAILVGTRTARLDNPTLTVRNWHGKSPLRIVLDKNLVLSPALHLFDGSTPTLVVTGKSRGSSKNLEYIQMDYQKKILPQLLETLYYRGIQSLLVEGGSTLLQSFIDAGLWDEACIETSPALLHSGVKAPLLPTACLYNTELHFDRKIRHYAPIRP